MASEPEVERAPEHAPPASGYLLLVPPDTDAWTIEMSGVMSVLRSKWKVLLATALGVGVLAAVITLQLPNIYRSQVVLTIVDSNDSSLSSSIGGQLSGLAALAGVQLGAGGGKREERLATLQSQGMARDFITANKLAPILFRDKWDESRRAWRTDEKPPTLEDAVRLFVGDVRVIAEDKRTGIVTVSMEWKDPQTAARWANSYVQMTNERLRTQALDNARLSIEFLNRELEKQDLVQSRDAIYRLIESQINKAMIANVQREFAFKVIDAAVASDRKRKVAPRRSLITAAVSVLTTMLVAGVILYRRRREWLVRPASPALQR
jgi:uncharacterized protein involved in exopolysaccharide biosynthesis